MSGKIKITMDVPEDLYKELQKFLAEKYGRVYGHIGESFIDGLKIWLKNQKANLVQGEAECRIR